jgi:hypothetical protein
MSGVPSAFDANEVGTIVGLCMRINPGIGFDTEAVLSMDAVAFRPMIVVHEDGRIEGLNRTNEIEADLFDGTASSFCRILEAVLG